MQSHTAVTASDEKPDVITTEHLADAGENGGDGATGSAMAMRARDDDLSIWHSLQKHKLVVTIAMVAAFSASLDGYREQLPSSTRTPLVLTLAHRDQSERRHRF